MIKTEAHHHMYHVFSTKYTCATDFFLENVKKAFLQMISQQLLAQAGNIVHDHIFNLWQLKG